MKIGIDISQIVYEGTGVANYVEKLVKGLIKEDKKNEYILFFSSLRRTLPSSVKDISKNNPHVIIKEFKLPPNALDILWNKLHIFPIEWFIGNIDVYISSDWTQPPVKNAKSVTILYDLIVYKYPEETHNKWNFSLKNMLFQANIVKLQKQKLMWVKKEVDKIICISEATKRDAINILGIPDDKLVVIYPGGSL